MITNINVWSVPLFKIMYHMLKFETIFEDDFVLSSIVKTDLLSISKKIQYHVSWVPPRPKIGANVVISVLLNQVSDQK